jgi:methanol metabolism-related c-type cytochrome
MPVTTPKFKTLIVACTGIALAMGLSACDSEKPAAEKKDDKAVAAAPEAPAAAAPVAKDEKMAAAPEAAAPAPVAPAAAPADAAPASAATGAKTPAELDKAAQDGKAFKDGKWALADGSPTYDITGEGEGENRIIKKVDWNTYSGWRRYHAECHVCHGPNAKGSTYAPALSDSLKTITYEKFLQVVSGGQKEIWGGKNSIMPALGDNPNVMCYIDDLYVYLRARSTDSLPPGRLSADQRAEKPKEAVEAEASCIPK